MSAVQELVRQFGNLFRWWVVVAPWEQAIRVRLGKHVTLLGPGVYLRIPGVDQVYRQSVRRRFSNLPTQTISTKDGRALTISGAIGYHIQDIGRLYDTLHHAEDTLQSEVMAVVARQIRARDLSECDPGEVEAAATAELDFLRYGIAGVEFVITDFVAVRTYRLIQGSPKDYNSGADGVLSTSNVDGGPR